MDEYKLSAVLEGHKLDVRCISSFNAVPELGKIENLCKIFRKILVRLWTDIIIENGRILEIRKLSKQNYLTISEIVQF